MSKDLMEFIWQDFGFRYISKNQVFWKEKTIKAVILLLILHLNNLSKVPNFFFSSLFSAKPHCQYFYFLLFFKFVFVAKVVIDHP
jgi:hypothetical protein